MTQISELLDQDCPRLPDIIVEACCTASRWTPIESRDIDFDTRETVLANDTAEKPLHWSPASLLCTRFAHRPPRFGHSATARHRHNRADLVYMIDTLHRKPLGFRHDAGAPSICSDTVGRAGGIVILNGAHRRRSCAGGLQADALD